MLRRCWADVPEPVCARRGQRPIQFPDYFAENLDLIVAERVPEEGIGAAINDRLRRAATN